MYRRKSSEAEDRQILSIDFHNDHFKKRDVANPSFLVVCWNDERNHWLACSVA
jgi:hypothetical protein